MASVFFNVFITLLYLFLIKIGTVKINSLKLKVEKKAILICLMAIILSFLVLLAPWDGIQNNFAKGGLTVVGLIILFMIWIVIMKKVNKRKYKKSVKLLEKYLKDYLI
ncbi:hypothetical protein [Bacillus sp. EB01]|uniref:hypothetical protein n=1 Tax=Bacillus sp. EB01 TaxID=1347086 RepID=UPI0005C78B5D|nr:hypothetical protein [Bacillus sp. EB01]